MADSTVHANHPHQHGPGCGHVGIEHAGHVDYLHDGHLHHQDADGRVVEHQLQVTTTNPNCCTSGQSPVSHEAGHVHGPGCGHPAVPHDEHVDYLVDGHLHHPHDGHCDDHGPVKLA